jgi:hypothetical protein
VAIDAGDLHQKQLIEAGFFNVLALAAWCILLSYNCRA